MHARAFDTINRATSEEKEMRMDTRSDFWVVITLLYFLLYVL